MKCHCHGGRAAPIFRAISVQSQLQGNYGNRRGMYIRTYVYLSMYKINFDSYVPSAPLVTVQKLECGIPTLSFSFVKKNGRAHLIRTQVHSDRNVYLSRFARYYLLSFQPPFQGPNYHNFAKRPWARPAPIGQNCTIRCSKRSAQQTLNFYVRSNIPFTLVVNMQDSIHILIVMFYF